MSMDAPRPAPFNIPMAYRIRELRELKGWTQGQLALRTGLTQGAISLYESGQREPAFDVGLKIAEALGVKPDKLVSDEGHETFIHTIEQVVLRLPENRQSEALAILQALASAARAS